MKEVLIIGATSDVAKATAHEYAIRGHDVCITCRKQEVADRLAKDIAIRYDVKARGYELDITDFSIDIEQLIAPLPETTFCFVGYLGDQEKAQNSKQEARQIMEVNYNGPALLLEQIAALYEKNGKGVIVGVSSVAGDRGRQSNYFYGSAKAAFSAYLSGLRNRMFHHGVHVCTVKPGFMATKMTEGMDLPKPITASPEKAARTIIKMASKKKNVGYVLWMWRYIMMIIKFIPEPIFKRLKM